MRKNWVCNECDFPNLTDSVPEIEIELELHACIKCGGFEFHLVEVKIDEETLEAKLRNQLTPIYNLAQVVLTLDEKPEIKDIAISLAKQCLINKSQIDSLLVQIENKK